MGTSAGNQSRAVTAPLASRNVTAMRELFHDLGNQLATLSCLAEILDSEPDLSQKARHQVSMMRIQTTRMLELLQHGLDRRPLPKTVPIRQLVHEVVAAVNARHETVVILLSGDEQWLTTHPAALWRVVDNVVDNAARAAGPTGRVEASVHREHHTVVIEVTDNGPGFGKGPPGTASLGLGIVASLARQCHGHIEILPRHPNGSRIRLGFQGIYT